MPATSPAWSIPAQLVGILGQDDAVAVMESIYRLSDGKMEAPGISADAVVKDLVKCGYLKSADVADRFGDQSAFDVFADTDIVGPGRNL